VIKAPTKHPITKHPITKYPITKYPITKHPITKHPITNDTGACGIQIGCRLPTISIYVYREI
jgi:hypothetical protein